jgi:hypothetical protein
MPPPANGLAIPSIVPLKETAGAGAGAAGAVAGGTAAGAGAGGENGCEAIGDMPPSIVCLKPPGAGAGASAVPQLVQRGAPSGFAVPQLGQARIAADYSKPCRMAANRRR